MRWIVVFMLTFVGCVATLPADDGLTADVACEAARLIVQLRHNIPPAPKPASDKCQNCDGTGKIGDGRIVMTCPVCEGTGKPAKSVVKHAPAVLEQPCPDGKCRK